jgi:hypothetical protein
MQSTAGNRATAAVVQRARSADKGKAPENGDASAGAKKKDYRDRIAGLLDRLKKAFELGDTNSQGIQTPANAGFTQEAAATANEGLKHSAAVSGTSAASENLLTEALGTVVNGMDAYKNMKDARTHETGAKHHTARKKAKVKGADAVVGAVGSGSYSAAIAKEATKVRKAADAAVASEASGAASASIGVIKGVRAVFRVGTAARKYKRVKELKDPRLIEPAALARLNEAYEQAQWAAAEAYVALDAYWDHEGEERLELVSEAIDAAWEAMGEVRDTADTIRRTEKKWQGEAERLTKAKEYAKKKQLTKIGKEAVGGAMGETTKAAAGVVTAVAAGTAGLASNPVGWGLAAAGAGLVFSVTLYKALRAATKRYEEKRHPERWAPEGETPEEAASRGDSLKHALTFWKKVSKGERQAMAREIYALAAGPGIPGSGDTTLEMRESARALLIALKAGPTDHKLDPEGWAQTLDDPAKTANWISEIAEQLASG